MEDVLNMSDEQFAELPMEMPEEPGTEEAEYEQSDPEPGSDSDPGVEEDHTGEEDTDPVYEEEAPQEDDTAEEDDEQGDESSDDEEASDVDYKAAYERLTAPFKANGKDMQVESVDDAIALMQMGANYNKKMAALKPNLKLMKMLDNNGVLSEDKLSFFIDLEQKNPDAIKKLIRESGVDLYDVDENQADYKPNTYTVDDSELELDSVLEEIRGTDTYESTLDVVSNKWDTASRRTIADNPHILKLINEQMGNGLFEQITTEIERDKMLGRLSGVSDIEAYRQVGDRLYNAGKFNQNTATSPTQSNGSTPATSKKTVANAKRKRAAATPRSSSASSNPSSFSPLNLSDEQFEKEFSEKFL
ncbi:hypothetical protein IT774_07675 [Salinimonas marina]|uniref:Tape measure protein n=1 Tax=Salinimonas marina TaxID=2785918 RepID=A0A7S9DZV1_9ALTE|nr:hypothetical protein [Salinimonas marina]QPG06974.1 hypothetical protein IT774_07675 [Salinimonas marina]